MHIFLASQSNFIALFSKANLNQGHPLFAFSAQSENLQGLLTHLFGLISIYFILLLFLQDCFLVIVILFLFCPFLLGQHMLVPFENIQQFDQFIIAEHMQVYYFINLMQSGQEEDDGDQTVKSIPKVFADEALKRGPEFYSYQSQQQFMKIKWADGSIYACEQKIGRGKYSEVFNSINMNNSNKCVVKMLKPVGENKITRQIKLLMALYGHENIIKLVDLVKQNNIYCLVFERVNTRDTKALLREFTPSEGKFYLFQILQALHYCHSMGIMHRDIKPTNMVIDLDNKKLKLIDWGLGQFYLPNKQFNVHVASRYYKPPELLVDYEYYHYSLDIWSFGALLASFIFKIQPMFKGSDNIDQLKKISQVLGTQQLWNYVKKYNMILDDDVEKSIQHFEPKKFQEFINEGNKERADSDALDLLKKILIYDHNLRPTAEECMNHPYFYEQRAKYEKQKGKE